MKSPRDHDQNDEYQERRRDFREIRKDRSRSRSPESVHLHRSQVYRRGNNDEYQKRQRDFRKTRTDRSRSRSPASAHLNWRQRHDNDQNDEYRERRRAINKDQLQSRSRSPESAHLHRSRLQQRGQNVRCDEYWNFKRPQGFREPRDDQSQSRYPESARRRHLHHSQPRRVEPVRNGTSSNFIELNKKLMDPRTDILAMFEVSRELFDEINISTAIHQLAKRQKSARVSDLRLRQLLDAAALRVEGSVMFQPRNLASMAWGVAKLGVVAPALFDAIAEAALRKVGEFKPQNLANTAWAFATAGVAAPALFDAIAEASRRKVGEFKPQNIANTAWAFATASVAAPALFGAIAEAARPKLVSSTTKNSSIVTNPSPLASSASK